MLLTWIEKEIPKEKPSTTVVGYRINSLYDPTLSPQEKEIVILARVFEKLAESDVSHISPSTQGNREFLNMVNFVNYVINHSADTSSLYSTFLQFLKTPLYYSPITPESTTLNSLIDTMTIESDSKKQKLSEEVVNDRETSLFCHTFLQLSPSLFYGKEPSALSLDRDIYYRSMIETIHSEVDHRVLHKLICSSSQLSM